MTAAKQDLIEEGRTEGERLAHSRALEALTLGFQTQSSRIARSGAAPRRTRQSP
jgi:hypothetical protein